MRKGNCNMIDVVKIIYEANKLNVWLWHQDNKLKYKFPSDIDFSDIIIILKENKDDILKVLENNSVSIDQFIRFFIYHIEVKSSILSFSQDRLWFIEQYERGTY
ncbi:hypothetical protein, partial [uncultured Aquimarina sp.]|uniref:TubC N-terminal docking domain-related protein n=1 Tax=uncultured Aquimarina sp. TaxID=575652 RepID=UPI002612D9E8